MTPTATLVDDCEDDRLYRTSGGDHYLVSRYGSRMYGNQCTFIRNADACGDSDDPPVAEYDGPVTHDEAMARFGYEVTK